VRNGRIAPQRFEIEPAAIAPLLSETFIAECVGPHKYRFRLAGTKICNYFGRELRNTELLDFWYAEDRDSIVALLGNVFGEGAAGQVLFTGHARNNRSCEFELILLPLSHGGPAINRALGAISAIEPPFWLGAEPMLRQELTEVNVYWPDGAPQHLQIRRETLHELPAVGAAARRSFTVHEGGLARHD
jgi:hypothetical protein